jgi:hypothetical protein
MQPHLFGGLAEVDSLDAYLAKYGPLLGRQAEENLKPLVNPAVDGDHPLIGELLRAPYPAQAKVITGGVAAMRRQKALLLVAEAGSGKTLQSAAMIHCHAAGRPYNALVMCPGQLTKKWKRELEETLPGVKVRIIEKCSDLIPIWELWTNGGFRKGQYWFILGRDSAKLGSAKKPAYVLKYVNKGMGRKPHCPKCGAAIMEKTKEGDGIRFAEPESIGEKIHECPACEEQLWQSIPKPRRFEPAKFIHKKLRGMIDYFIADEIHELKGADTAQANAMGSLAAASKHVIAMTGTLIGGYADHIRPILWRLSPATLLTEGFNWEGHLPFSEKYGRIEIRTTEREGPAEGNKQSRGSKKTTTKYVRPGIVPSLYGNHLIGNSIFLGLDEMGENLPLLREGVYPVVVSSEILSSYKEIERDLMKHIKEMVRKGDKRLLATLLTTLMAYPDHPFGWRAVGYKEKGGGFVPCAFPQNHSEDVVYPKEQALIDLCLTERALGRQVWAYIQFNGERDVESRLARLLRASGLTVGVLKASVPVKDREEWIMRNGADVDVMLSHPVLVQTGLDLFDKGGYGHNFCTLAFYETGYVLPTLRQASRRAWRLRQPKECKVAYFYYEGTMQERAMNLMGQKLLAAEALEGKFSSEGLIALAGDDGMETALARSLVSGFDESVGREWTGSRSGRARTITLKEVC